VVPVVDVKVKLPLEPLKQPSMVVLLDVDDELWLDWSVELGDCAAGLVLDGLAWLGSGAVLDGFWVAGVWLVEF
jgi:hypothetical protein